MSGFDVLVLGDANPDLVLVGEEVVPAFGQAERLVDDARLVIGGSGAIFACGAAKLGLRVAFAAVVGDDVFGRFMCDQLQAHGVDTSAIAMLPDRSTGVTVVLSGREDRAMLTFPGTIGDLRRSVIDADLLRKTRHIHVSSYFLQQALIPELPALFAEARDGEATTSIDPNWDPSGDVGQRPARAAPGRRRVPAQRGRGAQPRPHLRDRGRDRPVALGRCRHRRRQDRGAGRGRRAGERADDRARDHDAARRLHGRGRLLRRGLHRRVPGRRAARAGAWRSGTRAARSPRAASAAPRHRPRWSRRWRRSSGAPP